MIYSTFSFFRLRRMEGVYSERSERRRGNSGLLKSRPTARWPGFWPLSLLPSTLGLIILLQQSKLRNESNGYLGLCPLERFFFLSFLFGEVKEGWVGPPCAALERRELNLRKSPFLSILRSWARERKYDICVGFSNETQHFFFFLIRKAQSHTLTSMMGTTSALRRSNEQQFSAWLYLE